MRMDLDRLVRVAGMLERLFYCLMFLALALALTGSAGSGFLLLVLGSCAQVGRAALEEFVDRERARGERSKPQPQPLARSRSGSRRADRRGRAPRVAKRAS